MRARIVRLVRRHQPGCLVSGRIGTMNDSWGYRPTDTHYKSVEEILDIRRTCASIGSNYMLNVGPDPLGRLPVAAVDILDGLRAFSV